MIVVMRDAVMPECCKTCVCSEGYGCGITCTMMTTKEMESRPDWCPLEEVESCEDAVSREAVVRFLDDWISVLDANCHHQSMADLKIVKNDFENLPSAQPMRKRGEWRRISADKYVRHAYAFYRCSECGLDSIGEANFCPNCGASMSEGEEDETDRC